MIMKQRKYQFGKWAAAAIFALIAAFFLGRVKLYGA